MARIQPNQVPQPIKKSGFRFDDNLRLQPQPPPGSLLQLYQICRGVQERLGGGGLRECMTTPTILTAHCMCSGLDMSSQQYPSIDVVYALVLTAYTHKSHSKELQLYPTKQHILGGPGPSHFCIGRRPGPPGSYSPDLAWSSQQSKVIRQAKFRLGHDEELRMA